MHSIFGDSKMHYCTLEAYFPEIYIQSMYIYIYIIYIL